jgi:predicted nucleic-acid-binding Zn-ribbon protein
MLENWMRSKAILLCPACGDDRWRFAEAAYVRALLEAGEADLTEGKGVVRVSCGNCGYVMLFDAETVGIRGLWDKGRDL